jgi:TolB-like protein/DNA-binding winged helix-turn-helix (wHTH) protein/tetratricopeptide (TPR) repeat protein
MTGTLRFGPFELDVRSRELRKGKTCVRLQEQPFEILRMMLERPGDVVTREELCSRLWPNGTFVDFEHSLNAAVKRLRAALGDEADNPRFVETLPRRGYRFIATRDADPPMLAGAVSVPVHRVRLAVLPFAIVGDEPGQEYFADGLTEEMIAQLGQLCRGRIGIIARSSSMMFKQSGQRAKEIGQILSADYLLEGSVRQEGDRVRVTARLVETSGETHLWIETYERHLTDCLSVQADVAARIARSLTMELMPEERPGAHATSKDAGAYQSYLKARFHWNKPGDEGVDEAIDYYQQSLASDPGFAAAYAGIARARILRAEYYGDVPRRVLELARNSAKRALELEPSLSEAHLAMAEIRRTLEWDWRGAESSYSQAIVLNPSHEGAHRSFGVMLAALSRTDEAIRESERACELDPLCLVVNSSAAWVRFVAGDYEEAISRCLHTVAMSPRFSAARRVLGAAYLQSGREGDAIQSLQGAMAQAEKDPVLLAWLAHARAAVGDRDEARSLLAKLQRMSERRFVPSFHVALAHVGLDEKDQAFAALERATVECDPSLPNLVVDPRFEPIRGDARYSRLVELLGL